MLAWRRDRRFLSVYELHALVAGTSKALGLPAQAIQHVCTEYVIRKRQFRKIRLSWRSSKRSLGWIPFPNQAIRRQGDSIHFGGRVFRLWLSRPVEGTIKAGNFSQDARGRWYVNLQCEVAERTEPLGPGEIGIDLGLREHIACSDGVIYSRDNVTRTYEAPVGACPARPQKAASHGHPRQDQEHPQGLDAQSHDRHCQTCPVHRRG